MVAAQEADIQETQNENGVEELGLIHSTEPTTETIED